VERTELGLPESAGHQGSPPGFRTVSFSMVWSLPRSVINQNPGVGTRVIPPVANRSVFTAEEWVSFLSRWMLSS
jgi:hypothetical protein